MFKNLIPNSDELRAVHLRITEPSPWIARFAPLVAKGGLVLDLAAGAGRHGRHFMKQGCRVVFTDRHTEALKDLRNKKNAKVITTDLEDGKVPFIAGGPLQALTFDAIIIVNYLYRPLTVSLINALAPGGILLFETFARGNEDFARPRNPDHLLRHGELLDEASGRLQIIAYEHGRLDITDIPGVKQRICAIKDLDLSDRPDGEPRAHPIFP